MYVHVCTFVHCSSSVHVGPKSLKRSALRDIALKDIVNALHEAGFADADWELLGAQLEMPQAEMANIR